MSFLAGFAFVLLFILLIFLGMLLGLVVGVAHVVISPMGIAAAIIGCTIWVFRDATRLKTHGGFLEKDVHPFIWTLGCLLLWVPFFPIYLIRRKRYCERACANDSLFALRYREEVRENRIFGTVLVLIMASVVIALGVAFLLLHLLGPIRISPFM
jgi:hypothetical protein